MNGPTTFKHLDLFSGIGGFALAARWMGWETVGFCDNERFARRVLAKHWPGVPQWDDIRNINEPIQCDIITGGFPCQPFSVAGKQKGKADNRYLWPEMLRVVALQKPSWVVGENVAGLIGMGLDTVLADLESEGYAAWPFVVPACAVGAPHRRDRVWIVAHLSFERNGRLPVFKGGSLKASCDPIWCCKDVAHADSNDGHRGSGVVQVGRNRSPETASGTCNTPGTQRLPEPGLGGAPDGVSGWLDGSWEHGIPRVATGVRHRVARLKGLGNAVVPQVVYRIFKAIEAYERK